MAYFIIIRVYTDRPSDSRAHRFLVKKIHRRIETSDFGSTYFSGVVREATLDFIILCTSIEHRHRLLGWPDILRTCTQRRHADLLVLAHKFHTCLNMLKKKTVRSH